MAGMEMEYEGTIVNESGSWIDQLDWAGVRQEVEAEARAEIVLAGMGNAGKSTLFNSLRGWPVTLTALKLGRTERTVEERMGLFTLVDLPEAGNPDVWEADSLERASLLVYVLDGAVGCRDADVDAAVVRPVDSRWIGLLRSTGRPMLVVLNKADLWAGRLDEVLDTVERRLGSEVIPVSAYDPPNDQHQFLARVVEICPDLSVPLGQEIAAFRRIVVQRLTRRAALLCGLVAMEPIPLIDLPMQIGAQVGLVARIGAIYGHPPTSDYSKELVLAGVGSVALRLLAQQAAKAVPVLGWAVSGLLGAATTWVVGQMALAYFEGHAIPRGVGQWLSDCWQERLRPWGGRIAGGLLRYCPLVYVVRWIQGLWERWKARRQNVGRGSVRQNTHHVVDLEVLDEVADAQTSQRDGRDTGRSGDLFYRGATAGLADRAPEWGHARRGPGDDGPVRARVGE